MKKVFGLGIVGIGVLGAGIAILTHSTLPMVNDYDSCVKAGYPLLQTKPVTCQSPDGKTFPNPNEKVDTLIPAY